MPPKAPIKKEYPGFYILYCSKACDLLFLADNFWILLSCIQSPPKPTPLYVFRFIYTSYLHKSASTTNLVSNKQSVSVFSSFCVLLKSPSPFHCGLFHCTCPKCWLFFLQKKSSQTTLFSSPNQENLPI